MLVYFTFDPRTLQYMLPCRIYEVFCGKIYSYLHFLWYIKGETKHLYMIWCPLDEEVEHTEDKCWRSSAIFRYRTSNSEHKLLGTETQIFNLSLTYSGYRDSIASLQRFEEETTCVKNSAQIKYIYNSIFSLIIFQVSKC